MLTPKRIEEYVETVIEREGYEDSDPGPYIVNSTDYSGYDEYEDDFDEDGFTSGISWYLALSFFENEWGEIEHYVAEDTVEKEQDYGGFGYKDLGDNEVAYLASFPLEPGENEFTLDDILNEMFSGGYDTPDADTLEDASALGFV